MTQRISGKFENPDQVEEIAEVRAETIELSAGSAHNIPPGHDSWVVGREQVGNLGLDVRQGIHVGEVELLGRDITGLAVHEAARILDEAGTGESLVSEIVRSLAEGAGFSFESKGTRTLKGIPGVRELFALIP